MASNWKEEQIINKLKSYDDENFSTISNNDYHILLSNKDIKSMLTYFCGNIKTRKENADLKEKISFYNLNEELLNKFQKEKLEKEALVNKLKEKKIQLEKIKQNKNQIIERKKEIFKEYNTNKKERERIMIMNKICAISEKKITNLNKQFKDYPKLENYRFTKKCNYNISEVDFNFEEFLVNNRMIMQEKLKDENLLNVLNQYTEEDLNRLNLYSINSKINLIKKGLQHLLENIQNENDESVLTSDNKSESLPFIRILEMARESLHNLQIQFIKSHKENDVYDTINDTHKQIIFNKLQKNSIDQNTEKSLNLLSLSKLNEQLDRMMTLSTLPIIKWSELKHNGLIKQSIKENRLQRAKLLLEYIKKSKFRVDNFVSKHLLPLSSILEEKYNDLNFCLKNELEMFKKFKLSYFNNQSIYSFKRFGYDSIVLQKLRIENKNQIFDLFFKFNFEKIKLTNLISKSKEMEQLIYNNREIIEAQRLSKEVCKEIKSFLSSEYLTTLKQQLAKSEKIKSILESLNKLIELQIEKIKPIFKDNELLNLIKKEYISNN